MLQRIKTAVLIIAAVIPMFFFRPYALGIIVIACTLASYEVTQLVSKKNNKAIFIVLLLFSLLFSLINKELAIGELVIHPLAFKLTLIGALLILLASMAVFIEGIEFKDLSVAMFIMIMLGLAINTLLRIYDMNVLLLLFTFLVTYGADTGAYFIGSKLGKHKLIERVSPNKTTEGFFGGVMFSLILGGIFSIVFLKDFNVWVLIVISVIMPCITQLGDLVFSVIKRSFSIKDFGNIFPGHGGALDRIDSLLFGLSFMSIILNLGLL